MAVIRAQVVLPYFTGLPEDVASNTFYFAPVASPTTGQMADMAGRIEASYHALGTNLSPVLTGAGTIKLYDMADPEPRQPLDTFEFLEPFDRGTGGLPEEVASVFSFRAVYASGQPNARRRGRVYLGPLAVSSVSPGDADQFTGWSGTSWNAVLTNWVSALVGDPEDPDYGGPWVVYSREDNIGRTVIEAWRDNVPDTQRRRGPAATSRATVPVVQ